VDRRHFLHTTGNAALSLSLGLNVWSRHELFAASDRTEAVSSSEHPAHKRKRPIRGVTVGDPYPLTERGGDTWVSAWADDNNLYSHSDDTSGFHQAAHSNIAFNKITGSDPLDLTGSTVNPMLDYGKGGEKGPDKCTWKSSGCTCLNGVLYWVVARHMYGEDSEDEYRRQPAHDASIIKSSDYGQTWTRSAQDNYNHPMFPGSRFATPYFIEYGRSAGVDNSDQYIYAVSNDGFWDCGNDMILGRVLKSKMPSLSGTDWEYFTGGDGMKSSAWAPHFNDAKPVVEGTRKWGMTGGVYVPAHGRYLMIGWYYRRAEENSRTPARIRLGVSTRRHVHGGRGPRSARMTRPRRDTTRRKSVRSFSPQIRSISLRRGIGTIGTFIASPSSHWN